MITINAELMQQAKERVAAQLPYSIELMTQFHRTNLPMITSRGNVHGPAHDNAAAWEEYDKKWTGLAVGSVVDDSPYWLIGRCQLTGERSYSCLGPKPSVEAAIEAAIERTYFELAYWANTATSKSNAA